MARALGQALVHLYTVVWNICRIHIYLSISIYLYITHVYRLMILQTKYLNDINRMTGTAQSNLPYIRGRTVPGANLEVEEGPLEGCGEALRLFL